MTGLSHQLRAFSAVHQAMQAAVDPLTGLRRALPPLSELFEAQQAAIDLFPRDGRSAEALDTWLPEGTAPAAIREPALHASELVQAGGFSPVLRISHHLAQQSSERAGFHQEFPRVAGWRDRLGFAVQLPAETVEVSFLRDRVFDDEETKMALHFQQSIAARFALPNRAAGSGSDLFQNTWQIPLDASGEPPVLPFLAREILERYFGQSSAEDAGLPKVLAHWIRGLQRRREHTRASQVCGRIAIDRPHGRLHIGLRASGPPRCELLCLREELGRHDFFRLKALRLTEREVEVIFWITQGKSDAEIAVILGTAHKTINKYVEKLLMKFDANNRTSAAVRAVEWLADPTVEFGQGW